MSTQPTIEMDGEILVGAEWTTPQDYIDDDLKAGLLPALKGNG